MATQITPTEFRKNFFALLKEMEETGQPVKIVTKTGSRFTVTPQGRPSKFDRIPKKDNVINGDPEEIVHMDWSGEVNFDLP
jgi:hypothetical protein